MLDSLQKAASSHYGFTIENFKILHQTNRTYVVSLQTMQGNFVLKSIFTPEKKLRFILEVEQYLRDRGIAIPILYPTLDGEPYLEWEGHHYVLQEKIQVSPSTPLSPEAIANKAILLGTMHANSLGFHSTYSPDHPNEYYWEQIYERKLKAISNWKEQYAESRSSKKKKILKYIDFFNIYGSGILLKLREHRQFQNWKNTPVSQHYISHGDFHSENVLQADDRLYIIDWEFVSYDYPSKDIGRLLYSVMKRHHIWDSSSFQILVAHYTQNNPLNDWQTELLYLDLSFPHNFFRFLQNRLYKDKSVEQIDYFLQREYGKMYYLLEQLQIKI